jgi:hypothetical protein
MAAVDDHAQSHRAAPAPGCTGAHREFAPQFFHILTRTARHGKPAWPLADLQQTVIQAEAQEGGGRKSRISLLGLDQMAAAIGTR